MPKKRVAKATTSTKPRTEPPQPPAVTPVLIPQATGGALMAGGQGQGGRPKEVLRRKCREEILSRKGIEFVAGVMDGTETEEQVVTVGSGKDARLVLRDVKPKIKDRLYAFELLSDRGFGKPDQAVQIEDERPRPTGEETMARIMELLPRVVAVLPIERQRLAELLAQRRQVEVLVQGKDVTPQRS